MNRLSEAVRREISERRQGGQTKREIMDDLCVGRSAVDRWTAEGRKRSPDWSDQCRMGRQPKLTAAQVKAVKRSFSHKRSATEVARVLSQAWGLVISRMTVSRIWHSCRVPRHYKKKTFIKALSSMNKQLRLEFCKAHRPSAACPWAFTDGKVLSLYSSTSYGTRMCWQRADDDLEEINGDLIARFFVYAVVGKGLKSKLVFTAPSPKRGSGEATGDRAFCGSDYIKLMRELSWSLDKWRPLRDYYLIRDRAKQHTSKASTAAMNTLGIPILESFPPQSWDINAIEFVWGQLMQELKGHRARTPDGFRDTIIRAWGRVKQSTIDKIVAGVSGRMDKIVAKDGAWISASKYAFSGSF